MTLRGLCWCSLSTFLFVLSPPANAQAPPAGEGAAEELTRGPVHEAFGQPVAFNPTAGIISPKAPPELVEELPPDQRPEGDNVAWISGYWHWDDEAKEFLWVSGIWRNLPPGRTWVPGYWGEATEGHQWVSGYWAAEQTTEVEYLPPPPETLETGPVGDAPTAESIWIPGCWMWQETRYLWRPGYYIAAQPDWVWVAAHYEWSPAGYVFVDGYWDYPLATRGMIFAPVRFAAYRPGFQYIPQVVIDTRYLTFALFSRPAYGHYYFGDYYANNYVRGGIYPWFAFHYTRYGYDPLFAHTDVFYSRRDARWETNLRQVYFQRRDNEAYRPARTFRAQAEAIRRADDRTAASMYLARSLNDRGRDFPVNVVQVNQTNITNIRNNVKIVNQARTERVRVEKQVVNEGSPAAKGGAKATARTAPVRVKVNATAANLATPAAKGTRPAARAPEIPAAPKASTAPPAKGGAKARLPDPDEVLRPEFRRPGKDRTDPMPKAGTPGKQDDPVPLPRPKKDIDDDPPAKKAPMPKVTPKKDRDDDPVRPPVPKPAPKKDRDDDPPPRPKVAPMPPAKADPPPRPKVEPPAKADPPKAAPPKAAPPKLDPPPKKGKDKDKDKD
ncbi:MAG TPA: hypothetical protein VM597_15590 [Gemmataceae bacterium]|nr:hypothetical protein [Gemmataceae bacterium]